MTTEPPPIPVYLEVGQKRVFATAPDWPGWSRGGRDEAAALQALVDYGPRYARALARASLVFQPPADTAALVVAGRQAGNASTDFGVADLPVPGEDQPLDAAGLARCEALLTACWATFDAAVEAATGRTLRTGPRGGGRDLAKVITHVQESYLGYLVSLGVKPPPVDPAPPDAALLPLRAAMLAALGASARGEIPARGPRGGLRWRPRYFVRRVAWHELDHAWEIEDRSGLSP